MSNKETADTQSLTEALAAVDSKVARSIIELTFENNYLLFMTDGKPRILYQGEFFGNSFPLCLIHEGKHALTRVPYEMLDLRFRRIFRRDRDKTSVLEAIKYSKEFILPPRDNMPNNLNPYIGQNIKAEIVSYPLAKSNDGKLRAIDHVRYFNPNDNSPLAEIWEARSWEASGVSPSGGVDKETPVFAFLNRKPTPVPIPV